MNLVAPHPWQVSTVEAKEIQLRLRSQLSTKPELGIVRTVAGVDVGVKNKVTKAAVVVLSYPELEPIERGVAETRVTMPYVPGLLSFREVPYFLPAKSWIPSLTSSSSMATDLPTRAASVSPVTWA
jgi:deoxyribonuclease V